MNEEPEKLHNHDDLVEGQIAVKNLLNFIDTEVDRLIVKLEQQNKEQAN